MSVLGRCRSHEEYVLAADEVSQFLIDRVKDLAPGSNPAFISQVTCQPRLVGSMRDCVFFGICTVVNKTQRPPMPLGRISIRTMDSQSMMHQQVSGFGVNGNFVRGVVSGRVVSNTLTETKCVGPSVIP